MNSNYQIGHDAEKTAAEYLRSHGFSIKNLNWKTKYCEIDIVAEKSKTIYFVEVKYRSNVRQGSGLEYITPTKLKQMKFAAEFWMSVNKYEGQAQLSALEVTPSGVSFIEHVL